MMNSDDRRAAPMRHTLQFLGLLACGLIVAGVAVFVMSGIIGAPNIARQGSASTGALSARSAMGIDYVSFGIGLAAGLIMAELARLSWSDMPRRAIAWVIANRRNARYCAYACFWIAVLIFV
jgi:hypothetical protein